MPKEHLNLVKHTDVLAPQTHTFESHTTSSLPKTAPKANTCSHPTHKKPTKRKSCHLLLHTDKHQHQSGLCNAEVWPPASVHTIIMKPDEKHC